MAGAVKPAPRAIFTLRSSGVIVVQAWRSLSGLRCRSAQSPSRPRPPPPRQGFSLLMLRQCRLPAELHASNLRWHPAFGSPRQDQVPLKLGEAAADREHQLAMWRGAVCPRIAQGAEARSGFVNGC